jgi:hypothetical protein
VDSVRRDLLDVLRVARSGGAENRDVGFRSFQTLAVIAKYMVVGNQEVGGRRPHSFGRFIANADDLGARVFVRHPQQITHMHVVEVYSGYFHKLWRDDKRLAPVCK